MFDQERLEKIQDLMHDFVEHQMKDHPEIFGDETLKPKEKGRNSDFSKEFYLRLKQQEYEKLYIDAVVKSEMNKEFMRYASLENPKTTLGKLVSGSFKKFKEWWDRTRKPEVTEKARTSILEQLREAGVRTDQHNEQQIPKSHRTDLGIER